MTDHPYDPEIKAVLDGLLLPMPGVQPGKMFGHLAYGVGGKMFAFLLDKGIAIKLPKPTVQSLIDGNTFVPFKPDGVRIWPEWLSIYRDANGYAQDEPLFRQSVEYVLETGKKK